MLSCARRRLRCSQITLQEWKVKSCTTAAYAMQFKCAHRSEVCILSAALFAAQLWRTFAWHIFESLVGSGFYCWLLYSVGKIRFEMNSMCSKDFQGNYIYTELKKKMGACQINNKLILYLQAFFWKYIAVNILLYLYLRFCVYSKC